MTDPRLPNTSYQAEYPLNRVTVTESGHEWHYDDTPGHERVRDAHKSGTYREVSANGRVVEVTVASHHSYVKHGLTETVDMNHDHKVGGSHRFNVSGDAHAEVKGHSTSQCDGDCKMIVGGDHVTAVRGDSVHGVTGQMIMKIGAGMQIKGDSNVASKIDASANLEFGKDVVISSLTSITLVVGSSSITITPSQITIDSPVVSISQKTYTGQTTKGGQSGDKVLTEAGEALQHWSVTG